MKLTKARLQRVINTMNNSNNKNQTRKKFKKTKILHHTNSRRNRKQFNLHNNTVKQI